MASVPSPSKTSLSASKVTELKALCSKHGLAVSGNKSELVNRLLVYFESVQSSASPQVPGNKDITQSSNSTPAVHSTPSKPPPASKPAPPQINKPIETAQPTTSHNVNSNQTNDQVKEVSKTTQQNPIDSGEIEKRKQRAQRFGLELQNGTNGATSNEDEIKKLTRAKRFGISNEVNGALDRPLLDGKDASIKSVTDLEWEARKRKRAEKFGLIDNPPSSHHKDNGFYRKNKKFNDHRPRY